MYFQDLKEHLTVVTLSLEQEGYNSFVPNEDTVVLMKGHDGKWYRVAYIQLCDPVKCWQDDENTNPVLISQLEGLPDDPNNTEDLNNIEVRIFKEIQA